MTKLWTAAATSQTASHLLYVATTAELIKSDLALPESGSLVRSGRHLASRQEPTDESDHLDFAIGALTAVAHGRNLTLGQLELTDLIPEGLEETWVGGDGTTYLARVFIE